MLYAQPADLHGCPIVHHKHLADAIQCQRTATQVFCSVSIRQTTKQYATTNHTPTKAHLIQTSSSIQNVGPVFELIISSTSAAILLSLTSLLAAAPFTPNFKRIARCDNNILCMLIGPLAEKLVSPDRGTGVPPQDADGMP